MKPLVLFGGSFDPPHYGHLAVAQNALDYLKAEKVVFIPTKNTRFKTTSPAACRLSLLQAALVGQPAFEISTCELEVPGAETVSILTAAHFRSLFPARKIYFLLGADQAVQLERWHRPAELAATVSLTVVPRSGIVIDRALQDKYNLRLLPAFDCPLSSSTIRRGQNLMTPKAVIDQIVGRELYFVADLKKYYTEKRFAHALQTAELSYEIAAKNGLEPSKAYLAALYHDLAKKMTPEQCRRYMEDEPASAKSYPDYALHQFAGAGMAATLFKVTDRVILEAIRFHTTGAPQMGSYAKILFAADKIEPTRGFDSAALIAAVKADLDSGFIQVLRANRDYLSSKTQTAADNALTAACYAYYLN